MLGTTFSRVAAPKPLKNICAPPCVLSLHMLPVFCFLSLLFKGVPNGKETRCVLPASCKDFSHMVSVGGSMTKKYCHTALVRHSWCTLMPEPMVVCEYNTLTAGWLTCLPLTSSSHDWGKQVHAFGLCGSPFEASCHASQKLVVGAHLYVSSFSLSFFFSYFCFLLVLFASSHPSASL